MSKVTRRQQQVACRRAVGLARDLQQLLGDGSAPAAGSLRIVLTRIDYALDVALGYGFLADPEVAYRRGHARNVALVLRRTVETSLSVGVDAARGAGLLSQGARFADELAETVAWIRQNALQPDAPAPVELWTGTWAGRLLALTSQLLPREVQRQFVEDQCGNLACIESRREWLAYLLGLLVRMPRIAAAAPGRSRW